RRSFVEEPLHVTNIVARRQKNLLCNHGFLAKQLELHRIGVGDTAHVVNDGVPQLPEDAHSLEAEPFGRGILTLLREYVEAAGLKRIREELTEPIVDVFAVEPGVRFAERLPECPPAEMGRQYAAANLKFIESLVEDELGKVIHANGSYLFEETLERFD